MPKSPAKKSGPGQSIDSREGSEKQKLDPVTLYQGYSHPLGVVWPPHFTLPLKNVLKLHPSTHSPSDEAVGKLQVYSVLEASSDPKSAH